jgi:hypothetical protein
MRFDRPDPATAKQETAALRDFNPTYVRCTAEALLPIAAGAVGMVVLGLVFHIIASGGA